MRPGRANGSFWLMVKSVAIWRCHRTVSSDSRWQTADGIVRPIVGGAVHAQMACTSSVVCNLKLNEAMWAIHMSIVSSRSDRNNIIGTDSNKPIQAIRIFTVHQQAILALPSAVCYQNQTILSWWPIVGGTVRIQIARMSPSDQCWSYCKGLFLMGHFINANGSFYLMVRIMAIWWFHCMGSFNSRVHIADGIPRTACWRDSGDENVSHELIRMGSDGIVSVLSCWNMRTRMARSVSRWNAI